LKIFLDEPFKTAWQGLDPFQQALAISNTAPQEKIFRHKEGRRTLQFEFKNQSYFLKYHKGVGWKEIIKNLLQMRLPVIGAYNEYQAAIQLSALGIDTLTPVAYGCLGNNPARQHSFLITRDLINTLSLEDYCRAWPLQPPIFRVKLALINHVAHTARQMHEHGINHRDFYICHFLLEKNAESKILAKKDFHCYLIDLHRCQFRKQVPHRWRVKDLGGLLYSTMDTGLSLRDYLRFIREYSGGPLREVLKNPLWQVVLRNATKLYQKDFQKMPPKKFRQFMLKK